MLLFKVNITPKLLLGPILVLGVSTRMNKQPPYKDGYVLGNQQFVRTTHTLLFCWMSKPLPLRNQCTGCFTPAINQHLIIKTMAKWDTKLYKWLNFRNGTWFSKGMWSGSISINYLIKWAYAFEWCVVWRGSKSAHQTPMCLDVIGVHPQNMLTIIDSIVNILLRGERGFYVTKLWRLGYHLWKFISVWDGFQIYLRMKLAFAPSFKNQPNFNVCKS